MKKLLIIAAFAGALSLTASFGSGRIEIRSRPTYDARRAQQQREQQQRNRRHEQPQNYEVWVRFHQRDYDNRRL
jgi:hypothetical protein